MKRGWKRYNKQILTNRAGAVLLISHKIAKTVEMKTFYNDKSVNLSERITNIKLCVPDNRALKYMKKKQ